MNETSNETTLCPFGIGDCVTFPGDNTEFYINSFFCKDEVEIVRFIEGQYPPAFGGEPVRDPYADCLTRYNVNYKLLRLKKKFNVEDLVGVN